MAAIGLLELDLMIPDAHSLKEKRAVIRSIKDRVRNSYNVSLAEVAEQKKYQRSHLAVVAVATDRKEVEKRFNGVQELVEITPGAILLTRMVQWL
ncbi:DUF503 family protein [bacterium]|nr:DUF503 family protein [bacterium]